MLVQYYERKRKTGLNSKPTIEKIFAIMRDAQNDGKAVKSIIFTEEEYADLSRDFGMLMNAIKCYQRGEEAAAISEFFGIWVNTAKEIGYEDVDKVA